MGGGGSWDGGSSRQLCRQDGPHCPGEEAGGQGPDGGTAWLIGVTLRLSAGCVGTTCDHTFMCMAMMICRLCIRAIACLSMIEGMWVKLHPYAETHTYGIPSYAKGFQNT